MEGRVGPATASASASSSRAPISHGLLDTVTSIGATLDGVQFLHPWSTRQFTLERHLIHGPFSELFYLVLPLTLVTRVVFHLRKLP